MPSRGYYPNGLPEAVIHWVEAIKKGSECKCRWRADSVFYCEDEEMYVAGILYAVLDRPIQGSDPPHIFIDVEKNMKATTRDTIAKFILDKLRVEFPGRVHFVQRIGLENGEYSIDLERFQTYASMLDENMDSPSYSMSNLVYCLEDESPYLILQRVAKDTHMQLLWAKCMMLDAMMMFYLDEYRKFAQKTFSGSWAMPPIREIHLNGTIGLLSKSYDRIYDASVALSRFCNREICIDIDENVFNMLNRLGKEILLFETTNKLKGDPWD
ncbi:MAG: hypothetical protein E6R04_04105 [Spirochaetes bacterium]|nr:MAG: hypothetical protein E6R04_04105 [Spirochaetota bacterium]